MKSTIFVKAAAVATIVLGSLAVAQGAQARTNVYFSVGVPAPVYAPSQPVYVVPQPTYVVPEQTYVAPPTVYAPVYSGYDNWQWRQAEWRRAEWRREQWRREEWRRHQHHEWEGRR